MSQPATSFSTPRVNPEELIRQRKALSAGDRLALIDRVLAKAYNETESWYDCGVGPELAYLALAISEQRGAGDEWVQWSSVRESRTAHILSLFKKWFPDDDPVWLFIEVTD